MLKYEQGASHCYLAATPEALGLKTDNNVDSTIADLQKRGLPKHWGILLLSTDGKYVTSIKNAQSKAQAHPATILALTAQIAKSFCYRVLNGSMKTNEVANDSTAST
jgi:VCBS repeat-containing protein